MELYKVSDRQRKLITPNVSVCGKLY